MYATKSRTLLLCSAPDCSVCILFLEYSINNPRDIISIAELRHPQNSVKSWFDHYNGYKDDICKLEEQMSSTISFNGENVTHLVTKLTDAKQKKQFIVS